MFISIIIPIYKVENYLKQCIDSVLAKNLTDVEIILVDDGSPDNCPQICDEYAKKDNRVKVVHKENGGLSSARNAGLEHAKGEYVMFLDSDDWWNPAVNMGNVFQQVKEQKEVEMFLLTSLDFVEGEGLFQRKEHANLGSISTENIENYYEDLLNNGNLEVSAGTKIFKTNFLKNNQLYFKKGIKGEDNEWMIRVLRVLSKVAIINEPIYIYRAGRMDSISHSISKSNILDLLNIVSDSLHYYNQESANQKLKKLELCFCSYLWFSALGLTYHLSKKDKQSVMLVFQKTKAVSCYSNSKKTKLCAFVYKMFGFKVTAWLLGLYIKTKNKKQKNKIRVNG